MASPTPTLLSFIFLITFASSFLPTFASEPLSSSCIGNSNFSSRSSYGTNLNRLLSSLSSTTQVSSGFYNLSYGRYPDMAYALALCRGDMNPQTCRGCISNASTELPQSCPKKEAVIWYDECMLRYSNRSIFRKVEVSPNLMLYNIKSVSNPGEFNQVVRNLLDSLRKRAISGDSLRKFATGHAISSNLPTVYALVQCTPDLNATQCDDCLTKITDALPQCCDGKQGGRVLTPSCNFRYEIDRFYEGSDSIEVISPALAPAPPPSSGSDVPPPAASGSPAQPTGSDDGSRVASSPQPPSAASAEGQISSRILLAVFVALLVL